MNDIRNQLLSLRNDIISSALPHRFSPGVIEEINAMIVELNNTNIISNQLKAYARGLFRYISDDFEFLNSETGTKILDVINQIM